MFLLVNKQTRTPECSSKEVLCIINKRQSLQDLLLIFPVFPRSSVFFLSSSSFLGEDLWSLNFSMKEESEGKILKDERRKKC